MVTTEHSAAHSDEGAEKANGAEDLQAVVCKVTLDELSGRDQADLNGGRVPAVLLTSI